MVLDLRHGPGQGSLRNVNAATVLRDGHWSSAETSVSALTKWQLLARRNLEDRSSNSLNDSSQNVFFSLSDASLSIEFNEVPAVLGM